MHHVYQVMRAAGDLLIVGLLAAGAGCASNDLAVRYSPERRIDAVIVPGCPTRADGSLSRCLEERVLWAAHLWEQGLTACFIVSGAATTNRYVEAEAMAAGLVALDVPADRIVLEPQARHTDENAYYSLLVMKRLGLRTVAVASHGIHALGCCAFLESWGQPCVEAGMDAELVQERLAEPRYAVALDAVRVEPVADPGWLPVGAYEKRREQQGGPSRPNSAWLYFVAPLRRLLGDPWIPVPPHDGEPERYSDLLGRRSARAQHEGTAP